MVATPPSSLTDLPAEMVAAVELEAARQAQWLAQFLDALGPETIPKNRMTPRFLLHLGAALRLRTWEAQGFYFHRAAGLPDADQAPARPTPGSSMASEEWSGGEGQRAEKENGRQPRRQNGPEVIASV